MLVAVLQSCSEHEAEDAYDSTGVVSLNTVPKLDKWDEDIFQANQVKLI